MKKSFLLGVLMAFLIPWATVQAEEELTVNNGTTTVSPLPLYGLYADYGTRGQFVIPSDSLTNMASGTITAMKFYSQSASQSLTGTWEVYLKEVDETSASTTFISRDNASLVWTGNAVVSNGEMYLEFDDSYTYGGGNLMIEFLETAVGNCPSFSWYGIAGVGVYKYGTSSDHTTFQTAATGTATTAVPKVTFTYNPGGGQQGPVCDKPEAVDITDVTATSAVVNITGGSQTNYQIEYKAAGEDAAQKVTTNLTAYTLTGLQPYTAYTVQVKTICGDNTSAARNASFKTLIGIPYSDALAAQGEWTKKQGLLSDIMSGVDFGTSTGSWNFGARNDVLGGPHAYMNLYGTACKNWIISPMIPLPEGSNYVLTYDVALTDYNSANPVDNLGNQPDDKLVVLVSTDSCHTWTILQQWDNQGSSYVYDEIAVAGEEVEIDLSAYAGQSIQIAFYGESTLSNGDNDIHVGNVLIDYAPSCMMPDSLTLIDANTTKTSVQLDWKAKSGETAWILEYKKATDNDFTALNITQKPYTLTGLQEFTEYKVRLAAKCSDAEDGTSKFCKAITIKTASGVPFVQSFDTASLPSEWRRYEALLSDVINEGAQLEPVSKGWGVDAANGIFTSADNHLVLNLKDTTAYWIIGPTIEMEPNQQLTFDLAFTKSAGNKQAVETGKQNSQKFYVFISTNGGATWTDVAKWTNAGEGFSLDGINAEGQLAKIDLTAYATNSIQIAFYAESTNGEDASNNLHIANLKIDNIPACQKANSLNITGIQGTTATAVWEADENGTWEYGYVLKPATEFVPTNDDFIGTTEGTTFAMTGLTETTHYLFFVRRLCDTDTSEVLIKEFATIQTPADLPYNHDFESGNGWLLINGELENHWVWGEESRANNTANGSKALYISNDNFGSYAYSRGTGKAATVYATKTFYFDQTGMYSFQYDWRNYGYSTSDFLRVALVPADVELEASSAIPSGFSSSALPEDWEPLDGGSKLNLDSAWHHELFEVAIDKVGYYKMVFVWRNNTYTSGKNPPAAVDNVKIARIRCTKPTHLALAEVAAESASFNWDEVEGAAFEYAIVAADAEGMFVEPTEYTEVPNAANSIQLNNLTEKTSYKFYLRKACGGEDGVSDAISLEFTTKCLPYSIAANGGVYTEGFEDYEGTTYAAAGVVPDCWDAAIGAGATVLPHVIGSGSYYYKHEGTKALTFHGKGNCYAVLPKFAEALNTLQISFWMQTESATNGTLTLGYITAADNGDCSTFQAIKSFDNSYNAMSQREAVLSDISDEAYRLAFRWYYSGQYSCCIDDITVEEIPSCMKPTDVAVIDSLTTTSSATITWTPGLNETNWFVQYKKSADSVWTLVPDSVLSDTLVLAGLEAANTYDVRVAAWCNIADSTAVSEYSASITVATLCEPYSIADKGDYIVDFEAYNGVAYNAVGVTPVCWENGGTSTYGDPHVVDKTVSSSYAYVHEGNKSMNFCSSANAYAYAVLPEFVDSLKFLQIGFWAQMESATNGTLYLGYVDSVAYFHELTSYANSYGAMSYYESKLDTIPDEALRLAFVWYGATSSYYSCCIDDIKIMYIPDCQKPENVAAIDSLATANAAVLTWVPQGEETAWVVQYKQSTDSVWASIVADNDTFLLTGLKAATYYDVQVAAVCGATETSEYSIPAKFHTGCALVNEFPYNENFDIMEGKTSGRNLPLCWSQINVGTNTTYNYYPMVYKGATYANSGTNCLKFYSYYSSTASTTVTDQYAILPEMDGISALRIRFNARKYSASYDGSFVVGVMTDPADAATFVALDTIAPTAATYEPFRVLFNAYEGGGKYIAIKMNAPTSSYKGFYLDDIVVDSIPNCLEPDSLQAVLTKGHGSIATLNWAAGAASAWEVQYGKKADFTDAVTANVTEPTIDLTNLTSDSTYYARVKAICSETEESEWSNAISFTPMDAIIINDGTTTSNYVPLYGYYVDMGTSSQFIIPEKEIADITWDSITQLTFYTSSTYKNQSWSGSKFDVYVAETTDTVLNAMVAWTSMTKIVNSKHLELVDQQMVVTLDKPFQYQGGNLIIGVKETVTGDEGYSYWYGKTGVSGNSIYEYGTSSATKSNFNPKMKIDHVHGEMPTCFVVKNIAVSDITASSAALTWTPGTEDQNAWQVVYSADPAFDLANVAAEDIHDVAALPYAIAGLATDTLYKVYVRANCSDEENEDYSLWSELFTFHTASACQTPSDVKATEIGTTSALISWNTYGQTGFNIAWSDGTNNDTIYNVNSPYLLEGLTQKTIYSVKVQAACAAETNAWSAQSLFKTSYGIPFEEKFGESAPADWTQYVGLLSDVLNGTARTSSSLWYFGTANGVFDDHARLNVYGTSRDHWLETPAIYVEGDVQLTFDVALTKYSGTLAEITKTLGEDDRFVVLISTDNGDTWSILREWNNTGSEYVYNNIACSAEGEQVTINLAAYNGQSVKVAFYGESTVSETNSDNNLHVDNVLIDLVPSCIKPTGLNISEVKAHTAKVAWTAEEGQTAWQIAYATKATERPDTLSNKIDVNTNSFVLTDLDPSTTYFVYVRANCGEQDGYSKWTDGKSFKTTIACPAPTNLTATLTPGDGTVATLKWTAGGDEQAWRVEYSTNANMSDSIAVVVSDTTLVLTGLTAETKYYARVLADCGQLDSLSAYSAVISFTPTAAFTLTINEGTTTSEYVPVYGYYADNATQRSQFIIPEAALEDIEWGAIQSLTFYGYYSDNSRTTWGAAQFEAYVAEAPAATMTEEADWEAMTKVMNAASLTIVDGKMVVTFDSEFQYQGGDLMIGIKQTTAGSWARANWYGVTTTGASFGGYGTGTNYAQRNFLPKLTIEYVPGIAPACPNPKQLTVADETVDGATFTWKAVEGAAWEYAVALATEAEPANFTAVPENANTITLDNLDPETAYVFYLRRACGVDGYSDVLSIAFETIEIIETVPYIENFSDAQAWKLYNDATNAWTIGSAASESGNALYISNNGGAAYAYDGDASTASYATKLINFEVEDTTYIFEYEWKAVGEYYVSDEDPSESGPVDYLRVGLVPATSVIEAGTPNLPAGWIALDGDAALLGAANWNNKRVELAVAPGLYKVVFLWINDDADAGETPAAINYFSVRFKTGDATGFGGTDADAVKAVKFIRNNHVYILVNGIIYDATGRRIE